MEYHGKLYGKVGKSYFPLESTTEDFERLESKLNKCKIIANELLGSLPAEDDMDYDPGDALMKVELKIYQILHLLK